MKKRHSTTMLISLILLAVSATLLSTMLIMRSIYGLNHPLYAETRQIQELREIIAARYVGEYDEGELTEAALAATVAALGDRWSHYMSPAAFEEQQLRAQNRRQGIGVTFTECEETGGILILEVARGSPAAYAGLVAGEIILTLEGQSTVGMDTEEIREIVHDRYGAYVTLELQGLDGSKRTVDVAVEEFFSDPVYYEMLEDKMGYIRIANFDATSGEGSIAAVESLVEAGAVGLIFDVRSNGGGRLAELLLLLDHLLPEGELFIYADASGRETVYYAQSDAYVSMPMVVLVDEHAFSAAEYFAAILQEREWAYIVGQPTTGKGRTQITIPLSGGGAVRISVSRYFTPGRVDLSETGGIVPDYPVENTDAEIDAQLNAALELLR